MATREWVGLQLRKARQPKKQEIVAADIRAMGVPMSQNRLSRLERGETDMTPEEMAVFCRYYGVPPEYFLYQPGKPTADIEQVKEDKSTYSRLVKKLEYLNLDELDAIERVVDELKRKG